MANYTELADMWAGGCILADLAGGRPLFAVNEPHELLMQIFEAFGLPPHCHLPFWRSHACWSEAAEDVMGCLESERRREMHVRVYVHTHTHVYVHT